MSFLDNLENSLKSLESSEEAAESRQREQDRRQSERSRALATAPWAEKLKNGPVYGASSQAGDSRRV